MLNAGIVKHARTIQLHVGQFSLLISYEEPILVRAAHISLCNAGSGKEGPHSPVT